MCQDYSVNHIISSLGHAASNAKVERAMKIIKNMLKKSTYAQEFSAALLIYYDTPIGCKLPTPAELKFDRRIETDIPVKITCEWDEENAEFSQKYRQRYLATISAQSIPEFQKNQPVYFQDTVLNRNGSKDTLQPGQTAQTHVCVKRLILRKVPREMLNIFTQ